MKKIKINNFSENLYYEKFNNGFEIFLIPMLNKKTYYASMGIKYGGSNIDFSIDSKKYNTPLGIAHFLEHKLFEQNESPFNFYGKSGTDVNACTTADYTLYYINGSNNFLNNLDYLLKWIFKFNITDDLVEKEMGIILEEARMYDDNPDRVLYDLSNKNIFINHPYKDKIIGTSSSIKSISKDDLNLCYNTFYRPSNMYLVVCGNFLFDETYELIKKNVLLIKNKTNNVLLEEYNELDRVSVEYEEIKMDTSIPKFSLSFKMNKSIFKDLDLSNYELDYYINMIISLGFGKSSDFLQNLFLNQYYNNANYNITDNESHYVISFYFDSYKVHECIDLVCNYITDITILEDDFKRMIKTWIASEVKLSDTPVGMGYSVIEDLTSYNEFKNNKIFDIRNLTFNKLLEVKSRLDFNNKSIVIINPKNSNILHK